MANLYIKAFSIANHFYNAEQVIRIIGDNSAPALILIGPNESDYSDESDDSNDLLEIVFSEERQIIDAELHVYTELLQPLQINATVLLGYSQNINIACNVISVTDDDFHNINIASIDALQVKIGPGSFDEHKYTSVISNKVISVHMICYDREDSVDMKKLHQLFPSAIHFHIEGNSEATAHIFDYVSDQPDIAVSSGKLLVAGAISIIDFECAYNGQGLKLKLANNNVPINTSVCKYLLAKKNDFALQKNARTIA